MLTEDPVNNTIFQPEFLSRRYVYTLEGGRKTPLQVSDGHRCPGARGVYLACTRHSIRLYSQVLYLR